MVENGCKKELGRGWSMWISIKPKTAFLQLPVNLQHLMLWGLSATWLFKLWISISKMFRSLQPAVPIQGQFFSASLAAWHSMHWFQWNGPRLWTCKQWEYIDLKLHLKLWLIWTQYTWSSSASTLLIALYYSLPICSMAHSCGSWTSLRARATRSFRAPHLPTVLKAERNQFLEQTQQRCDVQIMA